MQTNCLMQSLKTISVASIIIDLLTFLEYKTQNLMSIITIVLDFPKPKHKLIRSQRWRSHQKIRNKIIDNKTAVIVTK